MNSSSKNENLKEVKSMKKRNMKVLALLMTVTMDVETAEVQAPVHPEEQQHPPAEQQMHQAMPQQHLPAQQMLPAKIPQVQMMW